MAANSVEVSRRERKLSEVALVPVDTFLVWARTHPGIRRVNHHGKTFFAWSFASLEANDGCPGTLVLPHPLFSQGLHGGAFGRFPETSRAIVGDHRQGCGTREIA